MAAIRQVLAPRTFTVSAQPLRPMQWIRDDRRLCYNRRQHALSALRRMEMDLDLARQMLAELKPDASGTDWPEIDVEEANNP